MAVYTEVTQSDAQALINQLNLGEIIYFQGIKGGIENTNYFVTTTQGAYVLTIFERLTYEELPYYLYLMCHLAANGIPVPSPKLDATGRLLHSLYGKPCAVVDRLNGSSNLQPAPIHCAEVASTLAKMHLAGRTYERQQSNLRGLNWWNETARVVRPYLSAAQEALLQSELTHQNELVRTDAYKALPRGPIHADLFRDNVIFEGDHITGFFDFYFAGNDTWLFDIAVCINDWCVQLNTRVPIHENQAAFLEAYQTVRPLTAQEQLLLPDMLRAGALRFWLSRLWDFYLPRQASQLQAHDPTHFEQILRMRSVPA